MKLRLFSAAENRVPLRERFDNQNEDHSGKNTGYRGIEALVKNKALRFGNFRGGNSSGCNFGRQDIGVGKKPDAGICIEDFLVARGHGNNDEPDHG